jgi:hypothetical protein
MPLLIRGYFYLFRRYNDVKFGGNRKHDTGEQKVCNLIDICV